MTKIVNFRYVQNDGRIELGVPEELIAKEGNYRDGGCKLHFTTSESSIGTKEKFELYLFAEDINRLTKAMWTSYLKTEPSRAKKDFESMNKEIGNMDNKTNILVNRISSFDSLMITPCEILNDEGKELTLDDYDDIEEWTIEHEDVDDLENRQFMICKTCDFTTVNTFKFAEHKCNCAKRNMFQNVTLEK